MFDLYKAVANLQNAWPDLHDVDRALRIKQILDIGMGGRTLARAIGCSEGLIRHLRIAADAAEEDLQQARAGTLSTCQLVKKVLSRRKEQEEIMRANLKAQAQLAAQQGAEKIFSWLGSELSSSYAEQTLDEANRMLANAEYAGKLPTNRVPVEMSVENIISYCRPKNLLDDSAAVDCDAEIPLSRYARWLAHWAFYAFPEPEVRHEALRLAKTRLEKQSWVPPFARRRPGSTLQ